MAEVGEENFATSVAGQVYLSFRCCHLSPPLLSLLVLTSACEQERLRPVWMLRFLIGFGWKPKECANKFKTMLKYRSAFGCDDIRARIEVYLFTCILSC
jgi:hypothetical protein